MHCFVLRGFGFCAILASSIASSTVVAQVPDPCHNLYVSACTGADRNDGTGISQSGSKLIENLETVRAMVARDMTPEISARLKSDRGYRVAVFNALGAELGLTCEIVLSLSRDCINKLAAIAAKFTVADHSKGFPPVSLAAKYELIASPVTKTFRRSAQSKLLASINHEKKTAEVEKMVDELKAIMVRRVEKHVTDPVKRKLLVEQIQGIKSRPMHRLCDTNDLSGLMTPKEFYMGNTNTVSICPGTHLYASSVYMLSFTIAHEIAHSIGPEQYTMLASEKFGKKAGTRKDFEDAHPYSQALQCLRDVPTAGAKTLKHAPAGYVDSKIRLHHQMYYNAVMKFDEIGETFSDWLGIDVASEYLEKVYPNATVEERRLGYTNAIRYFCGRDVPNGEHRSTYRRALTVASLPRVRKQMGCTDSYPIGASCGAGQVEAAASEAKGAGGVK